MSKTRVALKIRKNQSTSGQAVIEYILLLSFVVATTALISKTIQGAFDSSILGFGSRLESSLKTGRLSTSRWTESAQ